MTRQEILAAIPHRDPFLLVDEVVERSETRIVGRKTFRGDEWFFAGHYPDYPLVPGVLLCEAAMQCGAILLSPLLSGEGARVPVATRMGDVRFKRMVRPGETILMEVELSERLADAFFLKAKVSVDGRLAVRFEFACTAAELTPANLPVTMESNLGRIMLTEDLEQLAARLLAGELTIEEFVCGAGRPMTADLGDAQVDLDRRRRCGFPEVVFAEGKTVAAMERIFAALLEHGADVLATRVSPEQAAGLAAIFPAGRYNAVGRTFRISVAAEPEGRRVGQAVRSPINDPENAGGTALRLSHPTGRVAIVTAGTSDLPVAEEARETALWTGAAVTMIQDVGVAGPHRLAANLAALQAADAVVVVAGMEGALPSVVGGHVACPVIAVPTSVGYGASFGGVAALLGMLNSCAANVTVVNIDAGFKGGYVAGLIAKNVAKARGRKQAVTATGRPSEVIV